MDFPQFKRHLFPQLLNIQDDADIDGDPGEQWERDFIAEEQKMPMKAGRDLAE